MTEKPLVSIVIPLYNGANFIEEALKCAISQDYKNKEIIVVNDGSTDNDAGRDICLKYADKITYLEKENGGCSSALNFGIRAAKGKYISWLSHDDLYLPNKLSYQIGLIDRLGLDENTIVSNSGGLIDKDGNAIAHPGVKTNATLSAKKFFSYLLFKKCLNGCGLLIPKSVFEKGLYFREDMRFVLDWNLWLKVAIEGFKVHIDSTELVKNRVHGGQVTVKQKELHKTEAIKTVEELFEMLRDKEPYFMQELYVFAFSTRKEITPKIKAYLKEKGITVPLFRPFGMYINQQTKKNLKKIYHKIRSSN